MRVSRRLKAARVLTELRASRLPRLAAAFLGVAGLVLATSLSAAAPATAAAGGSILSAGQELQAGQDLISSGGQYTLDMQTDGNLVVYGNGCVIWASGTAGTGSNDYLAMQGDGNLVIYQSDGHPVWASNTAGTGRQNYLAMQVDGNLVVYTSAGAPVWASGASSADQLCAPATMSAGKYIHSSSGQYKLNMQGDGNLVVYDNGTATWASNTAGTGSANYVAMQGDGNLVVYNSAGKPLWASNTAGTGSGNHLVMQNDGNLVVYTSAGKAVWASKTAGSGPGPSGIVSAAASMNGKAYCWDGGNTAGPTHGDGNGGDEATDCGSTSITGFDCGGLAIYAVYQATHITITRTTIQNFGTRVTSISQLQPGDVILFGGTWSSYQHVGIYAGDGYMWNANTAPAQGVQKVLVSWETAGLNFIGAVRF